MTDRIEKTVDLRAPIARVWKALTDHEEFGKWFRVKLDQPFTVGAVQTGHITYEGYEHMKWRSTVERMEAPHLFRVHVAGRGGCERSGRPTGRASHARHVPARGDLCRHASHGG